MTDQPTEHAAVTPCPVCGAPGGFHDEDPHAEAQARIPAHLMLPTSTSKREVEKAERQANYERWKASQAS